MFKLRYVLASIMFGFLFMQAYFFGKNDIVAMGLVFVSAVIIYNVVFDLQVGNKKALRVNTREGGVLHSFLSEEKTFLMRLVSFTLSLSFASVLIIILKGITLNHGAVTFFIIIIVISLIVFNFLNKESVAGNEEDPSLITDNLAEDLANHANNFLYVILLAIVLNIALSLFLSAHDVTVFLENKITFDNFDQFAAESAIAKSGHNDFSRPIMNLYILLDIFNMVKLFAFSMSFVLLQKGLEGVARKLTPVLKTLTLRAEKTFYASSLYGKISSFIKTLVSDTRKKSNLETSEKINDEGKQDA